LNRNAKTMAIVEVMRRGDSEAKKEVKDVFFDLETEEQNSK
jgi:hypothetical protein